MEKINKTSAKSYSAIGKSRWTGIYCFPITSLCLRTDRIEDFANIENQKNFLSLKHRKCSR